MAKKIPDKIYRERLTALRSVGYKLKLNKTAGYKTGSQKSAITIMETKKILFSKSEKESRRICKDKGRKVKASNESIIEGTINTGRILFSASEGSQKGQSSLSNYQKGLEDKDFWESERFDFTD